ncbi:MAG: glycosyltransferase family 9 protein [Gemmatimonadota bacterium]
MTTLAPPPGPSRAGAPAPRSVAIVLLSAIGDVVKGMPVATSLRRAWPEARISWVIQPVSAPLVRPHPDVDELLVFERRRRARGIAPFLDFRRRVAGRSFDLVLALQVYAKAGILTALLPSPRKLGFDRRRARDLNWLVTTERIPARPVQHVQEQYFEFLDHLGVPVVEEWNFGFDEAERAAQRAFFAELDRPALAVVLGATNPHRNWRPEGYARVLEAAQHDLGLQPVLVGSRSPGELEMAASVLALTRATPVDALRDDLRRLAWILDGAAVVLSPDTGPLHIADLLGRPVVGLYGYTDPRVTGPYRGGLELVVDRFTRPGEPPTRELRPGNLARITPGEVIAKLELALRKRA